MTWIYHQKVITRNTDCLLSLKGVSVVALSLFPEKAKEPAGSRVISVSSQKERKPLKEFPRCSVTHGRVDVSVRRLSLFHHFAGVTIQTGSRVSKIQA